MSGKNSKTWLAVAGAIVVAGAIGVGWWMGKGGQPSAPATPQTATPAATTAAPAATGGAAKPEALPATATVGTADAFAVLNCQPRQYNDSLALAVTFTQSVEAKADLSKFLQVTDTGAASGKPDQDTERSANGQQPSSVQPGDAAPKGKIVQGNWVVGSNPRMVYFPTSSRNARIRFRCARACRARATRLRWPRARTATW